MIESLAKPLYRFPYGVIQEHVAATDGLMELCGDEAGTLFHPVGIQLPCAKEVRNIVCVDSEKVDQYHWSFAALQLLSDGDDRIKGRIESMATSNL